MKRLILALLTGAAFAVSSPAYATVKTIVLVHGAFADGSGWKPVADILQSHDAGLHFHGISRKVNGGLRKCRQPAEYRWLTQ
jgi:pimeloyl-ACP methyl ester carboxylesterase